MRRFLKSAIVIARRDFAATVLSKAFIFFLLGPLFPVLLGGVFGGIGSRVAAQVERPVIAVLFSKSDYERLSSAREELAQGVGGDVVKLVHYKPRADLETQQKQLLSTREPPIRAVLSGSLHQPRLTGAVAGDPATVNQLRMLIANALSEQMESPDLPVTNVQLSSGSLAKDRALTAQMAQVVLFLLTLMLSTMVLSQLIEEKSNKIIEVIAAAIPIDAMFVGKLFAMLAASILGLLVWISAGALLLQMLSHGGLREIPPPAVGWATFLLLGIIYFGLNYLLLGAVFLTIGAQASTAREVQTMSMPVTFAQVLIFGFASTVIGSPNSAEGLAAAIFPLSSPMAMIARAAEQPELWPHLAAIAWQVAWVALILRIGSQLFRKTVLKSGPRSRWFSGWRGAAVRKPLS